MVGIVIISHSLPLAESVRQLADSMVQGRVPMAVAAGVDDPEHPLGTDATHIHRAIESVYDETGVVVLMDLGSALLSAEMALELLDDERRTRVHLCAAPLVEGAVAAAVQADTGGDLQRVAREAGRALMAKEAQLGIEASDPPAAMPSGVAVREARFTIRNKLGLHARPAARLVVCAAAFQAEITVRNLTRDSAAVSAKSINLVTMLDARQGHQIAIAAAGPDADDALAALGDLVESVFGEVEAAATSTTDQTTDRTRRPAGELVGIAASPGIAIGPAMHYHILSPLVAECRVDDPRAEWQRLETALRVARREIRALRDHALVQAGAEAAAIFDAHLLFLEDPALLDVARQGLDQRRINAEVCWQLAVDQFVDAYGALEDPYLQARATDLVDVGKRVLRQLVGEHPVALEFSQPCILVASDLTPSDLVQLDPDEVLGICTSLGGATSHSAILARALGIPAVVGIGPAILQVANETLLGLDGERGQMCINPPDVQTWQKRRESWLAARQAVRRASGQPAVTADGHRVEVMANIRGPADVRLALECGAEGVGLLRTEFLFLERADAPSEEEQQAAYQAIATALGQRPLIIRTLDAGGDKPLPYLDLQDESNPFLGQRGIRLCLERVDLFKTQLRAILRTSPGHRLKLMFPMISSVQEVRRAKEMLSEAQDELRQAGTPFDDGAEVGIMVEIPAAVAAAEQLAAEVDFFSIGTNDLSQYAMAADRTNAQVAALADPLQPAILRLIDQTVRAGHAAGIRVGLCGEMAGDPLAAPLLLGLGLDALSVNAPLIPPLKQALTRLTAAGAQTIVEEAMKLDSAAEVRRLAARQ